MGDVSRDEDDRVSGLQAAGERARIRVSRIDAERSLRELTSERRVHSVVPVEPLEPSHQQNRSSMHGDPPSVVRYPLDACASRRYDDMSSTIADDGAKGKETSANRASAAAIGCYRGNRDGNLGVRGHTLNQGARPLAIVAMWLLSGALLGARPASPEAARPETAVWLWAWERPEDLRFLEGRQDVGVAYLARTILVDTDMVTVRPRRNPLHVEGKTPLTVVVRIEVPRGHAPAHSTLGEMVRQTTMALAGTRSTRLQIDFDARASEIPYYRELLIRVRASLPKDMWLGITSLAAWCASDPSWLSDPSFPLPVDDVVPMVFSMGADASRVRTWLAVRGGFSVPACRGDFGFSTAEPASIPEGTRVVHVFSPSPWTRETFFKLPHWNRP